VIKHLVAAALLVALTTPLHADFSDIVRAIDRQEGVERVWIPFLGVARAFVRVARPEGLHDFQLVTFTNARHVDPQSLRDIMASKAGPGFKPLVQVWSRRSGEWTFIYAKPSPGDDRVELMVLTQDDDETVLVRVEVNTDVVARELEKRPREITHVATR
jgi:hypothetical protein